MLLSNNTDNLKEYLECFYTLTGIRIVVFDSGLVKIAEAPLKDCEFCKLVRSDPAADERCRQSNSYACMQSRDHNRLYSYVCHAGLSKSVTPISSGNIVIGCIMLSQMLHSNTEEDWNIVARRCESYQVNMDRLKEAFFGMRTIRKEQVDAAAQILEASAVYLWQQRSIFQLEDSLPRQIDEYITNNLHADLSADTLCKTFSISRSKLYKIAGASYGCGVEQLTRRLRIESAKKLLETTDYPVSEIAYQSGYRDYNYFIKVFKKETGETPAHYRKHCKRSKFD